MRNFHVIKDGMDVGALALAISTNPDLWKPDTFLRNFQQGPFGDTDTIMLRFPEIKTGMSEEEIELYKQNKIAGVDQHESIARPAWDKLTQAHPFIFDLARFTQATRIGRVLINRIRPGGRIYPHADTPEQTCYWKRFHLVIQGQPGAIITSGDETLQMLTGRMFHFRNDLMHEVRNESSVDRLSMVIDLRV
jgi:hypothetical protein